MKSKYVFEKMELDGEIVAVPVGNNSNELHAVLYLNEEAMRILELLQEETTEEKVVSQLMTEYAGDRDDIRNLVHSFVEELRKEELIED